MAFEFYAVSSLDTDNFCRQLARSLNKLYKIGCMPMIKRKQAGKDIRKIAKKFHLRLEPVNFDALNAIDKIEFRFDGIWFKTRERKIGLL